MEGEKEQLAQSQAVNALLLEIVHNQKSNICNLVKVFRTTIACYTLLLLAMLVGFFMYENRDRVFGEVVNNESVLSEALDENYETENTEDVLVDSKEVVKERGK